MKLGVGRSFEGKLGRAEHIQFKIRSVSISDGLNLGFRFSGPVGFNAFKVSGSA